MAAFCCHAEEPKIYVSSSFHEPADEGLRFIYSRDGYNWTSIPGTWLKPDVGTQKLMRDPCIVRGPDGTFHLVWTSSWRKDYGIGYSSSKDLINWTPQRHIVLMEDYDPNTYSVWAPEMFYDEQSKEYSIAWASAIPGRFDGSHRQFYTVTKDFKSFTPPKIFYDPGYSSIDGAVLKRGEGDYVLAVKDNRRSPRDDSGLKYSNIHVAFGPTPVGPWSGESQAFTPEWSEGPTWAKVGDEYLIYFDLYRWGRYGAVKTTDFKTFTDITEKISVPKGHKHGTIFMAAESIVNNLLEASKEKANQADTN
ncbi:MAG: glycoside hydrolase family 43 protein [Sedimentisphaerales bacterium]|nr:glycoside hydrolase family 43 protein [Sedimentisphaerales bacterium]